MDAIAALLPLFRGSRPTWMQIREVCGMRNISERPVAAAFGYLPNPAAEDFQRFGYTDMIARIRVPGVVDLRIEDLEVNAAFEYFLIQNPKAKKCIIRSSGC